LHDKNLLLYTQRSDHCFTMSVCHDSTIFKVNCVRDLSTIQFRRSRKLIAWLLWHSSAYVKISVCFSVLLVSRPHCSAIFADDQSAVHELTSLEITCNVSYVGRLQPLFHCQPSAAEQPHQFENIRLDDLLVGSTEVRTRTVTVHYNHVINVTRFLNGTLLTCKMDFVHDSLSDATPPTNNFIWNSDPLVVTCKFVAFPSSFYGKYTA